MKLSNIVTLLGLLQATSAAKQQLRNLSKGSKKLSGARGGGKREPEKRQKETYPPWPIAETKPPAPLPPATASPVGVLRLDDPNDVGLRFSKVVFANGEIPGDAQLPMSRSSYPLELDTATWFRESLCPSIIVEADCFECDISFVSLIESAGGLPSNPSNDTSSEFWADFREVVIVQEKRLMNVSASSVLPLPVSWKDFDIDDVAEAVHDEPLGIYHLALVKLLNKQGAKVDKEIIPSTCIVEFIRGVVMLNYLINWSISTVGPLNFGIKYYVGRARPEEVAWNIHTGAIPAPQDLVEAIAARNLTSAESFTAYPEGSPRHPSWPAMHSAASSASLWLAVVMNLTDAQFCEVKRVDYAVAYARTVAGVHYPTDNIAGLNLGQEIVAQKLPQELHDKYGSDMEVVKAKIDQLRFNWEDFTSTDCYISGLYI
jgi:hypothetical protein